MARRGGLTRYVSQVANGHSVHLQLPNTADAVAWRLLELQDAECSASKNNDQAVTGVEEVGS
jgi:hypothetical protein